MDGVQAAGGGGRLGAHAGADGVRFAVWSSAAAAMWVAIFDEDGERELDRVPLARGEGDVHSAKVAGLEAGTRYGLRADGEYSPERGLRFDPDKLLMDPYAVGIDRPYVYDARLAAHRGEGGDTAHLMPKAIVPGKMPVVGRKAPLWRPSGLVYELQVRSFTIRHPDVPPGLRGTVAALGHPAVIGHLEKLGVTAVELMPVAAWIDERHLPALGLKNIWGYNPVGFMVPDPRLAPGGIAELRQAVAALHAAGIGVILDLVFNHTGESDEHGPTLCLRGLDGRAYYRHLPDDPGRLVNDTGTGNTLACDRPVVRQMVLDTLRHFVRHAGVDGFRFDLATVLGRTDRGFDRDAELLRAIADDPDLSDRVLIAEPWDIGRDGYQLGNFPAPYLEWNDRFRDDVRRFWRGDTGTVGALATRLAGSSDVFAGETTRSVNFIAAHDGMTLADLASYAHKHNEANGEGNRDGHDDNLSWNNGVEGGSGDAQVAEARRRDMRALLATLFASRGAIMLTAGDEFGRSQRGNNNAYAQDNDITWLDWNGRDGGLEDFAAALSAARERAGLTGDARFLTGRPDERGIADVEWLRPDGRRMEVADWEDAGCRCLTMLLAASDGKGPVAVLVNGSGDEVSFTLPDRAKGWRIMVASAAARAAGPAAFGLPPRSVAFVEEAAGTSRISGGKE
jgi:glycogen operon protein